MTGETQKAMSPANATAQRAPGVRPSGAVNEALQRIVGRFRPSSIGVVQSQCAALVPLLQGVGEGERAPLVVGIDTGPAPLGDDGLEALVLQVGSGFWRNWVDFERLYRHVGPGGLLIVLPMSSPGWRAQLFLGYLKVSFSWRYDGDVMYSPGLC